MLINSSHIHSYRKFTVYTYIYVFMHIFINMYAKKNVHKNVYNLMEEETS